MTDAKDPWWMTAMTVIAFIAWGLALTPVTHTIVPPDRFPAITGILTALLGVGPGLKVLNRK